MNTFAPQTQIPATYLLGGTSKGVFLSLPIYHSQHNPLAQPVTAYYYA